MGRPNPRDRRPQRRRAKEPDPIQGQIVRYLNLRLPWPTVSEGLLFAARHSRTKRSNAAAEPLQQARRRFILQLMAKLYFNYSTMNAGKSAVLLQAAHNYEERGMQVYLLTAQFDNRAGTGQIASRIGIKKAAVTYAPKEDLFRKIEHRLSEGPCACIFVDEAHFLSKEQVWQLARAVDDLGVPIMAYGLRVDFMGELFPASAALLALADDLREVRTICHCGRKATMVVRLDSEGTVAKGGDQVMVGGNESYVSLCRRHWREAMEDGNAPLV